LSAVLVALFKGLRRLAGAPPGWLSLQG